MEGTRKTHCIALKLCKTHFFREKIIFWKFHSNRLRFQFGHHTPGSAKWEICMGGILKTHCIALKLCKTHFFREKIIFWKFHGDPFQNKGSTTKFLNGTTMNLSEVPAQWSTWRRSPNELKKNRCLFQTKTYHLVIELFLYVVPFLRYFVNKFLRTTYNVQRTTFHTRTKSCSKNTVNRFFSVKNVWKTIFRAYWNFDRSQYFYVTPEGYEKVKSNEVLNSKQTTFYWRI